MMVTSVSAVELLRKLCDNSRMSSELYVIKADGKKELFDVFKLEHSLKLAGASSKSVEHIIEHIKKHLTYDITTHQIYKHAFELLYKAEHPIALKYSLKRAVQDLGPSGFAF